MLDERAVAQLGNRLLQFRLGVHHDRAVPGDRLLDRLARHQEEADSLFARLHRELKLTLIVATHDPDVAARADRVLHIVDGKLATPAVELAAPHCPPDPADTGKLESPRRTTTLLIGTPIISAAVWAMMV